MDTLDRAGAPEEDLIRSAVEGDAAAFNDLTRKYQGQIYGLARAILADHDSAEDAVQETFVKAFQGMHSFRGGSFGAWLKRIATNTCYDLLRTLRRHHTVAWFIEDIDGNEVESAPWLIDPRPSIEAQVESHETLRALQRQLHELPSRYRRVIALVALIGIDYADASKALDIPMGTVKSRLARARRLMRAKLYREADAAMHVDLPGAEACSCNMRPPWNLPRSVSRQPANRHQRE